MRAELENAYAESDAPRLTPIIRISEKKATGQLKIFNGQSSILQVGVLHHPLAGNPKFQFRISDFPAYGGCQ